MYLDGSPYTDNGAFFKYANLQQVVSTTRIFSYIFETPVFNVATQLIEYFVTGDKAPNTSEVPLRDMEIKLLDDPYERILDGEGLAEPYGNDKQYTNPDDTA